MYLRFSLSYRAVEEMPLERGVEVSCESLRRWVIRFGPAIARGVRRSAYRPGDIWHLDEAQATIRGEKFRLWRAVDEKMSISRITEPTAGPLFADMSGDGDEASGTIYVLRSKSELPDIAERRDLIHKIGVTNIPVERRIAGARLQPTFLMADVEIVTTYRLFNINRSKLENLIHRIFAPARLDIEIKDRFGNPVVPREWFLVPLNAIDDAVQKIKDGTITQFLYNPSVGRLDRRK